MRANTARTSASCLFCNRQLAVNEMPQAVTQRAKRYTIALRRIGDHRVRRRHLWRYLRPEGFRERDDAAWLLAQMIKMNLLTKRAGLGYICERKWYRWIKCHWSLVICHWSFVICQGS